jgi:hypothetical protein
LALPCPGVSLGEERRQDPAVGTEVDLATDADHGPADEPRLLDHPFHEGRVAQGLLAAPIFLKLGLRKLNISAAGLPWSSASISSRLKGWRKKSRSSISRSFCERNSLALRQVLQEVQQ